MKNQKLRRIIAGLLVCMIIVSMVPAVGAEGYLFQDDFSGDMSKWANARTNGGVIQVTDGQAVSTGVAQFSPAEETMITTGDLQICVEVKPVDNWAGIQFNMASKSGDNWSTTGYLLYVRPTGTADLLHGGPQTPLASGVAVPNFDANAMTKIKMVAADGHIKVYFNDTATASIDVEDSTYTEGYFGLASGGNNNVFDNFTVVGTQKAAASAEPTKLDSANIAILGPNVASHSSGPATNMLDGKTGDNYWETTSGTMEAYVTFDLGGTADLSKITVFPRTVVEDTRKRCIKDYEVFVSDTAPTYNGTDGTVPTGLPAPATASGTLESFASPVVSRDIVLPDNTTGRYVTVHIKNIQDAAFSCIDIAEMEFYATAFEAAPSGGDDSGDNAGDSSDDTVTLQQIDLTGGTFTASSQLTGHPTLSGTPIDGSLTTGWTTNPNTTDAAAEAWCQIALTSPITLSRLDLYPRYDTANIYDGGVGPLAFPEDFDILVSSNGTTWTTALSVTGHTVTAQEYQSFTFDTQENVSYIKINSTKMATDGATATSYRCQIMEMQAYGPAETANGDNTIPADAQKVTLTGGNVTVSSQISGNATWAPANAIDGNTGKGWSSDGPRTTTDYNEWIQVELPTATSLSHVVLVPRYGHGNNNVDQFLCFPQNFTIQVSANGTDWETVVTKTGYTASNQEGEVFSFVPRSNIKYIKVDATKLNHEGNTGYSSFRFQLMEMEAYYAPMSAEEAAASITGLAVDYDNAQLVLPEIADVTVEIASSSNESVISTIGAVDVVKGGTSEIVLKLTDANGNTFTTDAITVTVTGLLSSMSGAGKIASVTATSSHEAWPASHLINGNTGYGFWSNGDGAADQVEIVLTMEEVSEVTGVVLYPRVSPVDSSGATLFPENFEIFISADKETWTSVKKVTGYQHNNSTDPQYFYFDNQKDVQYVKLVIDRGGKYAQLAEIEVLVLPELETAAAAAEKLTAEQEDDTLVLGNISTQFKTEIIAINPSGIVDANGNITLPAQDTEVTLSIKVTNRLDTSDTATVIRKVLIKSQATLDVEAVAETVDLIPCPANDATQITLPSVPEGYTITISESDHPTVVDATGKITRSDDTTYGVRLTFKITNDSTGASALTDALLVPIYKTFVAPTMTQAEIDAAHETYNDYAYGVFVHYISEYDWGASVYADGTRVQTVDEAANAFDAEAFAKTMHDIGAEYVMLTLWHGDARPLFPSMTSQRWRDDRRAEDSTTKKSYSDRDVITDLLDALEPYDIDLHLYTHPTDGHDFTAEDMALTGHNDSSGSYATWNQYINELYYEVCERYGTRIKGLWFDGVFGRTSGAANQARLRQTCLTFNPGMILTMNTGFTEGNLNPAPGYTTPDYRAWEVNRYVDFVNDMKFSRYQSAIVIASKGWWTTVGKDATFNVQPAEDVFKYIVAMSSISTHGGLAASTGFYPVREGEVLDNYFMPGIYDMLVKVNKSYLDPVSESIKGTKNSTAYPTTENLTVSQLEWGVANESKDGRYIYLHVLNAPDGDTLNLPATEDGTELRSDAVIMNYDGTTTALTIAKTASGYSITLPEGVSWSEVDTVIKAERTSVTGVTLDAETKSMKTGETDNLTATVAPADAYDKSVSWTSSNKDAVTVDANGKLTAVGAGEATITVTTNDGGYTDTCKVTVTCPHAMSDEKYDGNGKHYTECTLKGCDHKTTAVNCTPTGGSCTTPVTCSVCGGTLEEAPGHALTKVEAKAATTEAEGNIEHYICSECGKYFSDAEGKNEITKESVVIPKLTPEDPTDPVDPDDGDDETKPTDPEKDEDKPESDTPQTGDNAHIVLWTTLAILALAGMSAIAFFTKRRNV